MLAAVLMLALAIMLRPGAYVGVAPLSRLAHARGLPQCLQARSLQANAQTAVTPRDPAFMGKRNKQFLSKFVQKRRDFLKASKGTKKDMLQYKKKYPTGLHSPRTVFLHTFSWLRTAIFIAV